MGTEAGGDAGSSNICSRSNQNPNSDTTSNLLNEYQARLEASALRAEAERVQMIMNYGGMEQRIEAICKINLDQVRDELESAKLRVMRSSVETVVDLAVKVLVAAEDGFGSKDINSILEKDAQKIVAAA